jgi:Polyketide cyclase / dehydrase and lipid transport
MLLPSRLLNGNNSRSKNFILRLIIASLLVFSLIILFLFALFPSDISVSRVIQIHKPSPEVFQKISDLREWKSWNDFFYDANTRNGIRVPADQEDSTQITGPYVSVDLLKAVQDTVITRWRQGNTSFTGSFQLTGLKGQTVVNWTLNFHISWYPWEKLASMFYERQLGPQMEKSMVNLRDELEKTPH